MGAAFPFKLAGSNTSIWIGTKTVPSITTSTNQLDLSAKDSANVQILVQNNDSPFCPPTPFTFAWKSSFKGLAATFQPQDGFTLKGPSSSRALQSFLALQVRFVLPLLRAPTGFGGTDRAPRVHESGGDVDISSNHQRDLPSCSR